GVQALSTAGWAGALAWASSTGIGLRAAHGARAGKGGSRRSRLLDLFARLARWVFVLGLLVALSLAGQVLLQAAGPALERLAGGLPATPAPAGSARLADHLLALGAAVAAHPRALALLVAAARSEEHTSELQSRE